MDTLHRERGHFCNWYDTQDLRPLEPVYVSTVDSGNLAGHLIALSQACRDLADRRRFRPETLEGVRDALLLAIESVERAEHSGRTQTVTAAQWDEAVAAVSAALEDPPTSRDGWERRLEELRMRTEDLFDIASTQWGDSVGGERSAPVVWARAVCDDVRSHARDLETLSPAATMALADRLTRLALRAEAIVRAMDFGFLYDGSSGLFSIGYRVTERALDESSY
jgi:cyclic beta-1,2-glucan synthetase